MFFNELELLKMRLEELDDVVDYFVLVESVETQRGGQKPLYFAGNAPLFEKFQSKIIYIANTEKHPRMTPWEREHFQRNLISQGLKHCELQDIIMISDLDEIPRPSKIAFLSELLNKRIYRTIAFEQDQYLYQLNRPTPTVRWRGTVATTYRNFKKHEPQHFRDRRNLYYAISNGGWHFTWMGGVQQIREKSMSVVEGNAHIHSITDEEIAAQIQSIPTIPISEHFPEYVRKNEAYLTSIGWIAPVK